MVTENLRKSLDAVSVKGNWAKIISQRARNKKVVLLWEASHGTHEYYESRMDLTKELIMGGNFWFVAVEGDWPSCFEVNRYVKNESVHSTAFDVLYKSFDRWPRWMWVNEDVRELVEWLRGYNSWKRESEKVGFYGLDLYSLWESLDVLLAHFKGDQESLAHIRRAYSCFGGYGRDESQYGQAARIVNASCEEDASKLLETVMRQSQYGGFESNLTTIMNALVIKNAERYYRSIAVTNDDSWNIRDRHMDTVLAALCAYFEGKKAIVWEHNTHVGDARATDMALDWMINVGQLARERYGEDCVHIVGFGSYVGSVVAGRSWWAGHETMQIPEAQDESWESLLHEYGEGSDLLLEFDEKSRKNPELAKWRGHRAIGVVYRPENERGNYVPTNLPRRYDSFCHIDRTHALTSLVFWWEKGEFETFPSGV